MTRKPVVYAVSFLMALLISMTIQVMRTKDTGLAAGRGARPNGSHPETVGATLDLREHNAELRKIIEEAEAKLTVRDRLMVTEIVGQ